jgi:tetratricopeptide (TPR) repeat protein
MGIADSLNALGMVAERLGDLGLARSCHEESLANRKKRDDPMGIAESIHYLAQIDAQEGKLDRAARAFARSLVIRRQLGDRISIADSLESIALLLGDAGLPDRATRLLAAVAALRAETESSTPPASKPRIEAVARRAREALGDEAFQSEWEKGSRLSLDDAIALASKTAPSPSAPPAQ